jgi:hypothetical protein
MGRGRHVLMCAHAPHACACMSTWAYIVEGICMRPCMHVCAHLLHMYAYVSAANGCGVEDMFFFLSLCMYESFRFMCMHVCVYVHMWVYMMHFSPKIDAHRQGEHCFCTHFYMYTCMRVCVHVSIHDAFLSWRYVRLGKKSIVFVSGGCLHILQCMCAHKHGFIALKNKQIGG